MIVGIIGMGVVGNAVYNGLIRKDHQVMVNDIKDIPYPISPLEALVEECEVIFICVPTPTNERGCDLSIVYDVFNKLHYLIAQKMRDGVTDTPVIAIKSTVIPGTVDSLCRMYPFVCSNPEFVREKTALHDFLNPDRIIIGTHSEKVSRIMKQVYADWKCKMYFVTPVEAEITKYMSNAFLLTKIAFSQITKKICDLVGADAYNVASMVCADHRINESHMNPNKGKISKDSACLPKDMKALIKQLDFSGNHATMLKSIYVEGVEGSVLVPDFKIKEEEV